MERRLSLGVEVVLGSAGCPWERRLSNGGQVIRWEWAARGNGARGRGPARARNVPRPFLPVLGPCSACVWITCCPLDHVCVRGSRAAHARAVFGSCVDHLLPVGSRVCAWTTWGRPWGDPLERRLSLGAQVVQRGSGDPLGVGGARDGARGRGPARARNVPRPFLPVLGPCSACVWITCCPLDHVCVRGSRAARVRAVFGMCVDHVLPVGSRVCAWTTWGRPWGDPLERRLSLGAQVVLGSAGCPTGDR